MSYQCFDFGDGSVGAASCRCGMSDLSMSSSYCFVVGSGGRGAAMEAQSSGQKCKRSDPK